MYESSAHLALVYKAGGSTAVQQNDPRGNLIEAVSRAEDVWSRHHTDARHRQKHTRYPMQRRTERLGGLS